jgi:DNA repair exonuclease SbcCD ATPase subunit
MCFICLRCGDEFDNITNLKNHLARKIKCQPILNDIDVNEIIIEDCKTDKMYACEYCSKSYSNKFNLKKHMKICKKREEESDEEEETIKSLKQQIKEKDKKIKKQDKKLKEKDEKIKEKDKKIKKQEVIINDLKQKIDDNEASLKKQNEQNIQLLENTQRFKIELKNNIPKAVRDKLWRDNFNDNPNGKCYVCKETVTYGNFHAGHIISVKDGGTHNINNLRVTCQLCNTSMGSQNLEEFKRNYFGNNIVV